MRPGGSRSRTLKRQRQLDEKVVTAAKHAIAVNKGTATTQQLTVPLANQLLTKLAYFVSAFAPATDFRDLTNGVAGVAKWDDFNFVDAQFALNEIDGLLFWKAKRGLTC